MAGLVGAVVVVVMLVVVAVAEVALLPGGVWGMVGGLLEGAASSMLDRPVSRACACTPRTHEHTHTATKTLV